MKIVKEKLKGGYTKIHHISAEQQYSVYFYMSHVETTIYKLI